MKSTIIKRINLKLEQIQILSNQKKIRILAEEIMLIDLPELIKCTK